MKTTDGGMSWTTQQNYFWEIYKIFFVNSSIGWRLASWLEFIGGKTLEKTTDGGDTWVEPNNIPDTWPVSIHFIDSQNGWLVGRGDNIWGAPGIFRTTDGGINWTELQGLPGYNYYQDIYFIDINTGWLVKTLQDSILSIYKTINGGDIWIEQYCDTVDVENYLSPHSIKFTDENNGWVCGTNGLILNTFNGGNNWNLQECTSTPSLTSISFVDNLNGWAVGDSGTILHTTNGGVTFIEEEQIDEIPTEFLLSQNYPNPFNPTTTIKYSVPKLNFVTNKIYDVLGSEVATLVNEEKLAGTYELNWSAADLPSGVYFYRMQSGSFVETKKMILLR